MVRVDELFPEGLSALFELRLLVELCRVFVEQYDKDNDRNYDYRNQNDILRNPSFSDFLKRFGVILRVIRGFVIGKRFFVVSASVKALAYTDVSRVKVVVALKYFHPVVNRSVVVTFICISDSFKQQIAVLSTSVNSDVIGSFVKNENVIIEVGNSFDRLNVTELLSSIAKDEQKISVGVVGVNLAALFVDYRPGLLRSNSDVDYL